MGVDNDFTWLLGNPHFEDTTIVLCGRPDLEPKLQLQVVPCAAEAGQQESDDNDMCTVQLHLKPLSPIFEHVHVNKAIISTVSEYWRNRTVGTNEPDTSRKRLKVNDSKYLDVLEETTTQDELPAVKLALHYAYSRQVPETIPEIMDAVRIADRWLMQGYLTACLDKLASLDQPDHALTAKDIGMVLTDDLPAAVLKHPTYQRVAEACVAALLRLFGKPQAVFNNNDPETLDPFCELPFRAVLLWAGQDRLEVDSENSVAVVLTCWWLRNAPKMEGLSKEVQQMRREQLSSALRIQHLSTSFYTGVLPQLSWFTSQHVPKSVETVQALREFNRMVPGLSLPDWALHLAPPAWLSPPRNVYDTGRQKWRNDTELVLSWVVTEGQLHELHQGCPEGKWDLYSDAFYWKGYNWMMMLNLVDHSSSLYVGVTMMTPLDGIKMPPLVSCSFELRCLNAKGNQIKKTTFAKHLLMGEGQNTLGCNDFLEVPATSSPRSSSLPPARLLVDGRLHLEVRIKGLDSNV